MQCHYPPNYVLDEMQWYEISAALKYQYYAVKDGWEQARLISFLIAQSNSRKKLKMEDILEFPWEKNSNEPTEDRTMISKEDIERLKQEAENYIKNMNNG
jgi:hypothetical protein